MNIHPMSTNRRRFHRRSRLLVAPSQPPRISSPAMKLPRFSLWLSLLFSVLLGGKMHAQSTYPMYYQSGPIATMQADSSSTGFEIPLERTGHSFSFNFRTANGNVSTSNPYPKGFITTGTGIGASAVFSFLFGDDIHALFLCLDAVHLYLQRIHLHLLYLYDRPVFMCRVVDFLC